MSAWLRSRPATSTASRSTTTPRTTDKCDHGATSGAGAVTTTGTRPRRVRTHCRTQRVREWWQSGRPAPVGRVGDRTAAADA